MDDFDFGWAEAAGISEAEYLTIKPYLIREATERLVQPEVDQRMVDQCLADFRAGTCTRLSVQDWNDGF